MTDRSRIGRISGLVRARLDLQGRAIERLEPDELADLEKLCQMAEYILDRHEQKRHVRDIMQELVDAIYGSAQSVTDIESEIDVLSGQAAASARQMGQISGSISGKRMLGPDSGVQLI